MTSHEDDALIHYGVKGMKWGRRRAGTRGGTPPSPRSAARAQLKVLQRQSQDAEDMIGAAKNPRERAKAQAEFDRIGVEFNKTRDIARGKPERDARKAARAARTNEILAARERQARREREYEEAQGEFMAARTNKGTEKAEKIMRQKERDLYVNSDLKKSQEWTTGEAAAISVVAAVGFAAITAVGMLSDPARR